MKTKTPPWYRTMRYVHSWIQLVESVVTILSFGFYWPNWTMEFVCWDAKRVIKWRIRERDGS